MRLIRSPIVAAFAALTASACLGQATTPLYLLKAHGLDDLVRSETPPGSGVPASDNTFWIGHQPAAIAFGAGRLFVGGQLGSGVLPRDGADADGDGDRAELSPFNIAIVKLDAFLTFPSAATIPDSRVTVNSVGLGYSGFDHAPNQGPMVRGLVATYDTGGGGPNLISRYNVDPVGSGVRVSPVPALITGFRIGSCGPSWDFGPTGAGVDYLPNGAPNGTPDGPAVSVLEFDAYGPYGTDPVTLNAGFGATLYELGINNGPRLAPALEPLLAWTDLDIDPRNGALAARADNTVVFATRNANGTATRVDLAPDDPASERLNQAASAGGLPGQRIAILHGYSDAAVGDLLIWNSRTSISPGQPATSTLRLNKTNRAAPADAGASVTPMFLGPSGSPVSLPPGNGQYDFAWDQAGQLLFILDTANASVYVLSNQPPRACCLPNGACFLLNASACALPEVGGTSASAGSVCNPTPCSQPTVACCAPGGVCQLSGAAVCMAAGGTPQALGSTCTPNACPGAPGACCTGSACAPTTQAACPGTFRGVGVTCDFAGNPVTCCRANFNQVGGVTIQDVFDFLTAYFTTSPSADINGVGGVTVQDVFDFLTLFFAGCPG